MKVSNYVAVIVVGFLTLMFAPDSLSQAAQKKAVEMSESKEAKNIYLCPMHPEVTSDKPGKCPKCGMELVLNKEKSKTTHNHNVPENSTANDKIGQARSLLTEAKKDLAQAGAYNCCIKDPCDRCALDHQSCPCADEVKSGKSVCPDCYAGWQRGDGIVKGVKASSVRGSFHSHKH
jgi:hypothetical protein